MQEYKIYRLEIRSPLNQPYTIFMRGGIDGLCDEDRYIVFGKVEGDDKVLMMNLTTGRMVPNPQPLSRFIPENELWARNDAEKANPALRRAAMDALYTEVAKQPLRPAA